jgi:hypothetical protein
MVSGRTIAAVMRSPQGVLASACGLFARAVRDLGGREPILAPNYIFKYMKYIMSVWLARGLYKHSVRLRGQPAAAKQG